MWVLSYRIHFALRDSSARNIFRDDQCFSNTLRSVFLNSHEFTFLFLTSRLDSEFIPWSSGLSHSLEVKWHGRWHQFGGQSAMRQWRGWGLWTHLRWVDRWWLGPAGHWLTLTLSHFSNTEWMDVVAAIVTSEARTFSLCGRQLFFAGNGGRSQRERSHQAFELGDMWNRWCWGGGQAVVFAAAKGSRGEEGPVVGPKIAWSWNLEWGRLLLRLLGRFFDVVVTGAVTVFDSAQYRVHHAQGLVSSK